MSIDHVRWAFEQRTGSASVKMVLVALADHANKHGLCYPSLDKLVEKTELAKSTVRKAIDALEHVHGLIEVVQQGRKGHSTRYRMRVGSDFISTTKGRLSAHNGPVPEVDSCRSEPSFVPNGAEIGADHRHLTISNHQSEPSLGHPTQQEGDLDLLGTPLPKANGKDKPKPKKRYGPHALPDDWFPSKDDIAYADKLGVDTYRTVDKFRHHHVAKGTRYARWDMAWQTWVRNCREWKRDLIQE